MLSWQMAKLKPNARFCVGDFGENMMHHQGIWGYSIVWQIRMGVHSQNHLSVLWKRAYRTILTYRLIPHKSHCGESNPHRRLEARIQDQSWCLICLNASFKHPAKPWVRWMWCWETVRCCPIPLRHLGMSENGVYPQWNSHLIGIMIINHWV